MNMKSWANWPTINQLIEVLEHKMCYGYNSGVEYLGDGKFIFRCLTISGCPWSPDVDEEEEIIEYIDAYRMWTNKGEKDIPLPPMPVGTADEFDLPF